MPHILKYEFIAHRINSISELLSLPAGLGVEIDIRDFEDKLVLRHDPFGSGKEDDLNKFLFHYRNRGTLILNIKSERIEHKILDLISKYKINDYFLLDSSFPMIHSLASEGKTKLSLRFSEWEGLDTIEKMKGRVEWVWVDCFTKFPLTKIIEEKIHSMGYKICIVSPELQGRPQDIDYYKNYIESNHIKIDAVCSKKNNLEIWKKNIKYLSID